MYLVIQKGYAIFGQGRTAWGAVNDMKQWIDSDNPMQGYTVKDFNRNYESAVIGEFVLVLSNEFLQHLYS
tara:strand:- start:218 stop:427 length:210 start_codon:yes stop_codon:yes gene_type:complete